MSWLLTMYLVVCDGHCRVPELASQQKRKRWALESWLLVLHKVSYRRFWQ